MNGIMTRESRRYRPTAGVIALCAMVVATATGCYSFRGGSAPAHLETIVIPEVVDNSGSGRGEIRFDLTNELVRRFREDGSLRVIDDQEADSRLEVTISVVQLNRRGANSLDRETTRGVRVEARATFYDNVRDRAIYERKLYAGESTYDVSEGIDGENGAIDEAIELLTNQVLLGTVAEW